MTRLSAATLIILGSFTEIYFYVYRYTAEGSPLWLSIIIGAALTIFLAVLTMMLKASRWYLLPALALGAYSVMMTAFGQRAALGIIIEEQSEHTAQQAITVDAITDYRQNVQRLDREEAQLLASTEGLTLRDRANFRTYGIAPIEERKAAIAEERLYWQALIDAERSELTTHETVERTELNVYAFYASVIGGRPESIQIFMQVVLSVFIALMAPAGIIMLLGSRPKAKQRAKAKPKKQRVTPEYARQVKQWAFISWVGIRAGRHSRLMDIDPVKRAAKSKDIPCDLFDKVLANAARRDILKKDTEGHYTPTVSEEEAVRILCGG